MKTKQRLTTLLTAAALSAGMAMAQTPMTIYTEDFGDATSNQPTTSVDWHWWYQGTEGTVQTPIATMEARTNPGLGGPGGFTGRALVAWGEGGNNAWETSNTFMFFDNSPTFDTSGGGSLIWSDLDEFRDGVEELAAKLHEIRQQRRAQALAEPPRGQA